MGDNDGGADGVVTAVGDDTVAADGTGDRSEPQPTIDTPRNAIAATTLACRRRS